MNSIITETCQISDTADGGLIGGDIRFDNVTFAYPTRQNVAVLRDLTLVARAGETTALVGSSGSGESFF